MVKRQTVPTVMVVEDEALLLQAITKKLRLSNIDVLACGGGRQAIDYLENLDRLPDAIWLDYYLNDISGLEFMRKVSEHPIWSQVPVIVVSNSASPDKVHSMMELGARKYVLKAEHRLDEIVELIRTFINTSTTNKEGA